MLKKSIFILLGLTTMVAAIQAQQDSTKVEANAYFKEGKLHFRSKDKKFHLWFDNRVYIDAAAYSTGADIDQMTTKPNKDIPVINDDAVDDGKFRFSNGIVLRRARIGFKAEYLKWFGELDVDVAYNLVEVEDMYLGYKFNDNFNIKVGNFKEPMSIERVTSSKALTAIERPMVVQALCEGRRLGVAGTGFGKIANTVGWWASAGFFGQTATAMLKERNRGNDGYGAAARLAITPVMNEQTTVHIGASGSYRTPESWWGNAVPTVEFRTTPESYVDHRRFVRTRIANVEDYMTTGLELAFRYDKFLAYGEYMFTDLSRSNSSGVALKNAEFDGWYVTASYMILGKAREYDPSEAEFKNAATRAKTGNLEVLGRVSTLNLNDFHDKKAVITGGSAYCYTAGINWYPTRNVLIGLNYTYTDNDKYADDNGSLQYKGQPLSKSYTQGLDFNTWQMRFLFSF
ncbi:MAG: OprO/OprP family phosphate-selective porin [Prevotellaceae bacterium]|jgi:phosphate-selective porin|nr:OprO/OprP family phosphate-selective porin [Prevotellaceae bacterium]